MPTLPANNRVDAYAVKLDVTSTADRAAASFDTAYRARRQNLHALRAQRIRYGRCCALRFGAAIGGRVDATGKLARRTGHQRSRFVARCDA